MWVGIISNTVIDPFFINVNLTGWLYLQLLEETITTAILAAIKNDAFVLHWLFSYPCKRIKERIYVRKLENLQEQRITIVCVVCATKTP